MLQKTLQMVRGQLDATLATETNQKKVMQELSTQLGEKLQDLTGIHQKIKNSLK
jgi:hypothetical protein